MRIALVIPLAFACGAVAMTVVLRGAPPEFTVDLRQPLVVVTYWQQFGALLCSILFGALALSGAAYATLLARLRIGRPFTLARICALSALACGAALAFPAIFSSDVYAYAAYGNMVLHGINPYAHVPMPAGDALFDAAAWQWGNPPPSCVYGPAFVAISALIVAVSGALATAAPLWMLRICACAALVCCALPAYAIFSRRSAQCGLAAAAGVCLNPVAIWSCAEGHNDALALLCVLAGVAIAVRSRTFAGSLFAPLSGALKAPGLGVAAVYALYARSRKTLASASTRGTAAGMLIALALNGPLIFAVTRHAAASGTYSPTFSLQFALSTIVPLSAAVCITLVLCGSTIAVGLRDVYRGDAAGCALIAAAAWCAIPNPYPWYSIWTLPAAFLARDRVTVAAVLGITAVACARYYGEATSALSPALNLLISLAQCIPLFVVIAARMYRARRVRPENRTSAPGFATLRFR